MDGKDCQPVNGMADYEVLLNNAENANRILRVLANATRLKILCFLAGGEKSVTEIKIVISQPQPTVSQQLAVLRSEGLVESRRDGRTIYYELKHPGTRGILDCLEGISEFGNEI